MRYRDLGSWLVCACSTGVLPGTVGAQVLRVDVLPFEAVEGADSALAGSLRDHVVAGLNARSRPRFDARNVAAEAVHDTTGGRRYVHARVGHYDGRDRVSFNVTTADGKQHATFEVAAPPAERQVLLRDALDRLALVLATSIRLGILEFQRTGGDSSRYDGLQRTLPNMLMSRLGGAAHLGLIELTDAERVREMRVTGGAPAGTADYATALELGRLRAANYVLFGDFLVLDQQLRIDVRCVSLETGEIVAVDGVVIEPITLSNIEREMTRVAAEIRTAVENDFVAPTRVTTAIAIGGFPPTPPTFRNRRVQEALIRATRDKLAALNNDQLAVRGDAGFDEEMTGRRLDPWVMASRMQARYVIALGLRRADPDSLQITFNLYDTASLLTLPPQYRVAFIDHVDEALDGLLADVLPQLIGDSIPEAPSRGHYRHPLPLLEVFVGLGAVRWTDPGLFLDASGAVALESGIGYRLREPLQARLLLRFEPYASPGPGRTAYGTHAMLGLTWDVRPRRSRSPFVGITVGSGGIVRRSETRIGYNSTTAVGGYVGYRLYWARHVPWTVRLEAMSTIGSIHGQTIGGTPFPGGRAGGVYLLFNTAL